MRLLSTLAALALGSAYAAWLSTDEGKAWIDENTTVGVVLGVGGVLGLLRFVLSGDEWWRVVGMFVAAGAPLVARGVMRKVGL